MIIATFEKCSTFNDKKTGKESVVYDNKVLQMDLSWKDISDLLMCDPTVEEHKHQSSMFSGWEYLTLPEAEPVVKWGTDYVRKVKGNLLNISLMIIDYDDELFIHEFLDKYPMYEAIIYTSHSHHNGLPYDKFRVVMPMTHNVSAETWGLMELGLLDYFKGCDRSTFALNRSFFLPCVRDNAALSEYISYHQQGEPFNPDIIPLEEVKEVVKRPIVHSDVVGGKGKILWKTLDAVSLFKQQGLYDKKSGNRGKHLVTCPWDNEHSSDTSGTAIWDGDSEDGPGFNCLHGSCHRKRTMYDVTQYFGADVCRPFCETEPVTLTDNRKRKNKLMMQEIAALKKQQQKLK